MKILILNYEYPPLGGGAGVVSKYHAEGLSKIGHTVTVITAWFRGEKEFEEIENLIIIKLKSKRKFLYKSNPIEWLSWINKSKKFLNQYLKENRFDFCFAHFALPGGEVAKYIRRKFNIPYAVISHGQDIPWFFPEQMFKYHLITYFWIKLICKKANKLILLTYAMKANADRFMRSSKHKNFIIPNACDTLTFSPDYEIKNNTFKVLFIGRLVKQKDPITFLKAIKILSNNLKEVFEVHIVGNGPLKQKMTEYVTKNKLQHIVHFRGWINKKDILYEYRTAHVQVISSKAEAMSISALEALSTGLYLISTPVSGNMDIITENVTGELFEFSNSHQLAEKILSFYKTKFAANYKIPDSILSDFRSNYDWKTVISKLTSILP